MSAERRSGGTVAEFLEAACVPRQGGHATGTLDQANRILAAHPEVGAADIYAAAALGDDETVRRLVAAEATSATAKGGPYQWDALTYLCFSRYLRLDRARTPGFVRAAEALLDAGANPNTGWYEDGHQPHPVWESAIYGAAGVAHHPELTRLLLEWGADPNDDETPYHAPEGHDNAALQVLVESGKLSDDSLAVILLRKTDWHDHDAIEALMQRGVDPDRTTPWGKTALHNALLSDNALETIDLLLDHGADPTLVAACPDRWDHSLPGRSAVAMAARRGRGDVLASLQQRGVAIELEGVERLLAACAMNDLEAIAAVIEREPDAVHQLLADGGRPLAEFAGNGDSDGVRHLLDLGVDVSAPFRQGDPYFGVPPGSTALHVAAWRARHRVVQLLVERGAPVDAVDANGRTPLQLAIRAGVDSYWRDRRSPASVGALLAAGAPVKGVSVPTGWPEMDALLAGEQP